MDSHNFLATKLIPWGRLAQTMKNEQVDLKRNFLGQKYDLFLFQIKNELIPKPYHRNLSSIFRTTYNEKKLFVIEKMGFSLWLLLAH